MGCVLLAGEDPSVDIEDRAAGVERGGVQQRGGEPFGFLVEVLLAVVGAQPHGVPEPAGDEQRVLPVLATLQRVPAVGLSPERVPHPDVADVAAPIVVR